ncbi:MAG: PTS fructose transporter subunit IIBC [uncultured Sulfurovum sp.]|uniref:PTS fructose transporter subunit IIBC n=1 Tax=uncultured Sulfurovum sp. TaxID=269237 RepID=A0A6S6TF80_9BACT|nr:MAG: PTS fructose transporter subunit IIBC [uncultured Sulfurovum sp.]
MQFLKTLFSKPYSAKLSITSSNGFHLRPAAKFVTEAKKFRSHIKAKKGLEEVDAKSVNTLLSLNLEKGDAFTLIAQGKDAQVAIQTLATYFKTLMHEDKAIEPVTTQVHTYQGKTVEVQSISLGVAIAPVYTYRKKEIYTATNITLQKATTLAQEELLALSKKESNNEGIYLAQKELLTSLTSNFDTLEMFEKRIEEQSHALIGGKHESKRADYQDILQRVKQQLGYTYVFDFPTEPFILIADDLLPSTISQLKQTAIEGVILRETSSTSHTAILLKAEGITSVICSTHFELHKRPIILDASCGVIVLQPSKDDVSQAALSQKKHEEEEERAYLKRFEPARTRKGKEVIVLANVSSIESAKEAKNEGAQGIGLLRTEFLFTKTQPSLEEQTQAYTDIFALFETITVRTLDVGGDKNLPYIDLKHEANPFLGIRGVRLFKSHSNIMDEQLHAIFKAANNKSIKVMFPMVSTVEEFNHAKSFAQEVAKKYHIDISNIDFGIMIEVPSVLFLLKEFNTVVDFYSIGTNDLTQYLFATERTHPTLEVNPLSPLIFNVIQSIIKNATKPVSLCGELASNISAIPQLLPLKVHTLSVSSKHIGKVKEEIRKY